HPPYRVAVAGQLGHAPTARYLPYQHRTVFAAPRHRLRIGAECRVQNGVTIVAEHGDGSSAIGLPDAHAARCCADHACAVGAETGELQIDGWLAPFRAHLTGLGVPYPHRVIGACGCDAGGVGTESRHVHASRVSRDGELVADLSRIEDARA